MSMVPSARTWLDVLLQQMAAECYLDGINLTDADLVTERLRNGNNDVRKPYFRGIDTTNFPGKTRFTDKQLEYFNETWKIVDHKINGVRK